MAINKAFYKAISVSTAHRLIREKHAAYVFENPEYFTDLFALAVDVTDQNHYKACWILEIVHEASPKWIESELPIFCGSLQSFRHVGAVRSISKICMLIAASHIKNQQTILNEKQIKQITECCFDWLIGTTKVASKVYAMRTLFEIGKLNSSIYFVLRNILEKDFPLHSSAYRSASKELLKKML